MFEAILYIQQIFIDYFINGITTKYKFKFVCYYFIPKKPHS